MKAVLGWWLFALALQAGVAAGFVCLAEAGYDGVRRIDEAWELPLTWTWLVVAGPLALFAVGRASLVLWQRVRMRWALPFSVVLLLPIATLAMLCTHTLGIVRNWW